MTGMYAPVPENKEFAPPPAGSHAAICYRLIDLGTQQTTFNNETKRQHKIMLSWELPGETMENGEPFSVHQRFTLSMHEKATLRKQLEAWRGRAFTDEEAAKFDISSILGKPCLLSIVHNQKGDRTYANIASVGKLPKGMEPPARKNALAFFTLADPDWSIYEGLSEGLRNVIAKSPEYHEARNGHHSEAPAEANGADMESDPIPF